MEVGGYIYQTISDVLPIGSAVVGLLTSDTSISSAAGALFGAVGAQFVASRMARSDLRLNELRNTNKSAYIAFSVFNTFASLKEQLTRDFAGRYRAQRSAILNELGTPTLQKYGRIEFDLRDLNVPRSLSDELFEAISQLSNTSPMNILNSEAIIACERTLDDLLKARKDWILKNFDPENPPLSEQDRQSRVFRYFAIASKDGVSDSRIKDIVDGVDLHVDSIIAFSYMITIQLSREAHILRRPFTRRFRKPLHSDAYIDFSKAIDEGLIPNLNDFSQRLPAAIRTRTKPWWMTHRAWEEKSFPDWSSEPTTVSQKRQRWGG